MTFSVVASSKIPKRTQLEVKKCTFRANAMIGSSSGTAYYYLPLDGSSNSLTGGK